MADSYRPVIIGAGVSGNALAYELTKLREKPIVIEQKRDVLGKACAGIVSKRILKLVELPRSLVKNRVNRLVLHFPKGEVEVRGKAIVLDREGFSEFLYERAKKGGTDYLFNERLMRFVVADKVIGRTSKRSFKTDILIGADGVDSVVAKKYGLSYRIESVVQAFGEYESDAVHVFLGKEYGYPFGYVIPYEKDMSIVGMGGSRESLERFLDFLGVRHVRKWQAGRIPVVLPKYTAFERVLLIGDAAGMVKALTGGGIIMDLLVSKIAAKAIREGYERNDFSTHFLKRHYEDVWKEKYFDELKLAYKLRMLYERMDEKDLNNLYDLFQKEEVLEIVEKYGDMDFYSGMTKRLMTNREVLKFALSFFARHLSAIFLALG